MAIPRFYVPELHTPGLIELGEAESKHAVGILRVAAGDPVVVFDGRGGQAAGRVVAATRRSVTIEAAEKVDRPGVPRRQVHLLIALPKGDRQKQMVDMLTQLGTASVTPLITRRGVAQPTAGALQRLGRVVIEACKQCGRNQLMEVRPAISVPEAVAGPAPGGNAVRVFAHIDARAPPLPTWLDRQPESPMVAAVGPEGGFTADEADALRTAGWQSVSLGARILRIETAAVAIATLAALPSDFDAGI